MTMTIRNALPNDLEGILALNQTALPHVNALEINDVERFLEKASYFKVIGDLDGFLIVLKPGLDYDSANYRWFSNAFDDFFYIDRIIIDKRARSQGLGSLLYKNIIEIARLQTARLTCEVNSRPPNPQSMSFHQRFGFTPIGTQKTEGGIKEVTMLSLELK